MQNTIFVCMQSDSPAGTGIKIKLYSSQQGEPGKSGADGKDGAAVRILELMQLSFHLACSVVFVFDLIDLKLFHYYECDLITPTIFS